MPGHVALVLWQLPGDSIRLDAQLRIQRRLQVSQGAQEASFASVRRFAGVSTGKTPRSIIASFLQRHGGPEKKIGLNEGTRERGETVAKSENLNDAQLGGTALRSRNLRN